MKKYASLVVALLMVSLAQAQQEIKMDEVNKHIGDSVTVCSKVYGGIYLQQSKGSPTFLNVGGAYPNSLLTLVIWDDVRKQFKEAPETFYKDKEVCITGKLILYKEKPEIVIYDEKQLMIKEN